jgi:hypothetical protein
VGDRSDPQDAVYIEVWTPHDRLGDLPALVTRRAPWATVGRSSSRHT